MAAKSRAHIKLKRMREKIKWAHAKYWCCRHGNEPKMICALSSIRSYSISRDSQFQRTCSARSHDIKFQNGSHPQEGSFFSMNSIASVWWAIHLCDRLTSSFFNCHSIHEKRSMHDRWRVHRRRDYALTCIQMHCYHRLVPIERNSFSTEEHVYKSVPCGIGSSQHLETNLWLWAMEQCPFSIGHSV